MCDVLLCFLLFVDLCLSQCLLSSQTSVEMDPKDKDRQRIFQEKADEAGVIIVVLSKAFAVSKISQQQVGFCLLFLYRNLLVLTFPNCSMDTGVPTVKTLDTNFFDILGVLL